MREGPYGATLARKLKLPSCEATSADATVSNVSFYRTLPQEKHIKRSAYLDQNKYRESLSAQTIDNAVSIVTSSLPMCTEAELYNILYSIT